jgi:biotin carboxylase
MTESHIPSILLVTAVGGPAPEYALPRLLARGTVDALVLTPLSDDHRALLDRQVASVVEPDLPAGASFEVVVTTIVDRAEATGAEAIVTFSEYAVRAVAEAAERLGLRGAGPNAARARDKLLMRERWTARGVPGPRWRPVRSASDVMAAYDELSPPFLLKPGLSAGSIGQQIIRSRGDAQPAFERAMAALANAASFGDRELGAPEHAGLLAEDIILATTEGWYDDPRYGDYLSVEGAVIDGRYHPVCITARLPTIPPFTELSNQAPCTLPETRQREVEAAARAAVDALGLETCGTHTELKLLPDGRLSLLETAARVPGAMVVREVEEVFGVDLIGALVDGLLGLPTGLPSQMLIGTGDLPCAAASLALLATDSTGEPWRSLPVFRPELIDWDALVGPGTAVEVIDAQSLPSGARMPRYNAASGVLNFAGLAVVISPTAAQLLEDSLSILDGLEEAMVRANRQHDEVKA